MTTTVTDPVTTDTEHVVLPTGELATLVTIYDDLAIVGLRTDDVTPQPYTTAWWQMSAADQLGAAWVTVAIIDITPAPETVVDCHDCEQLFDHTVAGRWCDNHGWLCASCAQGRKCGGCYVD